MFSSILIVCTGNICRSPMGEYLLRERWQAPGARVASAGVQALIDWPADEEAIKAMQARGIDLSPHRARQISPEISQDADLILVMEDFHRDWIHSRLPTARGRVHGMGKWIDLPEVPDPYRRGPAAFEQAYDLLDRCVDSWLERIG